MDPLTHGLLGAVAAQAVFSRQLGRWTWVAGMTAGMLPDLDILIRSAEDPFVALVYHRQFTHSLVFIPVCALVAALPFLLIPAWRYRRASILGATAIGASTHGLLDVLTAYGTVWFWPFSNARIAMDYIAIIDPIFTLILLLGLIVAAWRRNVKPARLAMLAATLYIALGGVQHQRAINALAYVAASRMDEPTRYRAMPTMGNLIIWRGIYEDHGRFHAMAIRVPLFGGPITIRQSESVPVFDRRRWPELADPDAEITRRFEVFRWFADGYVALTPTDREILGDMRYSIDTYGFNPLWGARRITDPAGMVTLTRVGLMTPEDRRSGLERLSNHLREPDPDAKPITDFTLPKD